MSTKSKQKKLGPAPFASFDMSEDLSSPESKGYKPMPEISEDYHQMGNNNDASSSTSTAQTPTTPRIDVEQASSPSQETSGDSTPERELFSMDPDCGGTANLSSEFLEGVDDVELRSSADELRIQYSTTVAQTQQASLLAAGTAAAAKRKVSWDAAGDNNRQKQSVGGAIMKHQRQNVERKGSAGILGNNKVSDPFFFPGRDSRLSSNSPSAYSVRRSPSPHRMKLETSFVGPKGNKDPKEAQQEDEMEELARISRRPSLLNPSPWLGDGYSRSASPINSQASPGSIRSGMVRYATEPRSRPTSPMGWISPAPSPTPDHHRPRGDSVVSSSRWLSSPRFERRASSPHRTLVETSFCGSQQKIQQVPDDDAVMAPPPRSGLSPLPPSSIGGSLLSIQAHLVKYATEPRSRPVSPTPSASRSFFSLAPAPPDSRRGSVPGRCPSPMIETSFCGPKQLARLDSVEAHAPSPVIAGSASTLKDSTRRPSAISTQDESMSSSLRPVRYMTEPRSRPVSPSPVPYCQPERVGGAAGLDSPQPNRAMRCVSPHRTIVETSFVTKKDPYANRQDSVGDTRSQQLTIDSGSCGKTTTTEVSVHPLPVRYATEPRSRPVSPSILSINSCALGTPDPERRSMRSPSRCLSPALVETSFCGVAPSTEENHHNEQHLSVTGEKRKNRQEQIQVPQQAVKYSTEPRSRPVSPSPSNLLSSATSTPDPIRRAIRSPSPNSRMIETSFCGTRAVPRPESLLVAPSNQERMDEAELVSSSSDTSIDSITEVSVVRNHKHFDRENETISDRGDSAVEKGYQQPQSSEFVTDWPDVSTNQSTKFDTPERQSSGASSEDTISLPSQNGSGHIISATPASAAPFSPSLSRPGRQMPKPVACPKPPKGFLPSPSDSSAQSSPTASPAFFRRGDYMEPTETASPSPSSPFPSRRTSLSGVFRRGSAATDEPSLSGTPSTSRKTSLAAVSKSGTTPVEEEPEMTPNAGEIPNKKNRSVLSVIFGKKSGKKNNKSNEEGNNSRALTLPVKSRDTSPGRSTGPSGDDLDEEDEDDKGFRHQVLMGVPDDEPGETSTIKKKPVAGATADAPPKEELGLFQHQESVEDDEGELPFVPTTLPIERPIAPLITPVRARIMSEVKTTPTERPRCSISFSPRSITDYVVQPTEESKASDGQQILPGEKIKIKVSLFRSTDREGSLEEEGAASAVTTPPIKVSMGTVKWEAFTEQVFSRSPSKRRAQASKEEVAVESKVEEAPPPTPVTIPPANTSRWINVEEIPEPIKEPKVIKVVSSIDKIRRNPTESDNKKGNSSASAGNPVSPSSRKDSVSSETALLREVDETEAEEDRSPPEEEAIESPRELEEVDDQSASIPDSEKVDSQSSSLAELDCHLEEGETVVSHSTHLLVVSSPTPFGMDLDVHSNRSSIAIPGDATSPDELSISIQ